MCPTRGYSRRVPRVKVAASGAVMMLEGDRCDFPGGSGDETLRKNLHIFIKIYFFHVLDSGQRARACTPRTGCDFFNKHVLKKKERERDGGFHRKSRRHVRGKEGQSADSS